MNVTEIDMDMRAEAEVTLNFPVEVDGETITSITMRRPKVRDQFKADRMKGTEAEKGIALLCDLTERPHEVLMELDDSDLEKLQAQYLAFKGRAVTPEA